MKPGHGSSMHYGLLAAMIALHFIAMYFLMYSMVDRAENVFLNLNNFYMAGLMTAPMVILELALMGSMYPEKGWNLAIIALAAILAIAFFAGIRQQAAIGDGEFLRSMIPHHAGAILMCRQAGIGDAEIRELCTEIIESQQREISQMKAILSRMENKTG